MNTGILILAAGKGSRMKTDKAKALVKVLGKELIVHLLENIKESNYSNEKIFIVVSEDNKEEIAEAIKDFNVEFIIQKKQLGTAHAVLSFVESKNDNVDFKNLLVLYADHPFISARIINNVLEKELSEEMPIHLLTCSRLCGFKEIFKHWGRILRNEDGKIVTIREYKDASEEEKAGIEVNPGIMSFNYSWLKDHLSKLNNENSASEYYLTDLVRLAFDENKEISTGGIIPKEAIGINTLEELKIAEDLYLGENLVCPF